MSISFGNMSVNYSDSRAHWGRHESRSPVRAPITAEPEECIHYYTSHSPTPPPRYTVAPPCYLGPHRTGDSDAMLEPIGFPTSPSDHYGGGYRADSPFERGRNPIPRGRAPRVSRFEYNAELSIPRGRSSARFGGRRYPRPPQRPNHSHDRRSWHGSPYASTIGHAPYGSREISSHGSSRGGSPNAIKDIIRATRNRRHDDRHNSSYRPYRGDDRSDSGSRSTSTGSHWSQITAGSYSDGNSQASEGSLVHVAAGGGVIDDEISDSCIQQ